ncbi:Ig-like domain-containing protein [Azospirillum thermophilum]|uniref:Tandem-95 repeat protein n=1 Tax=Azospirillum thermophilum TaxID=2202148 RepID=A0A2S2CUK6_9PROT|nr:Ig-like domain-containing protein [Azospirillum thermophilum]AWK88095.1 hypothetical protein DEW08_18370 [Azospirillum thermophilum]
MSFFEPKIVRASTATGGTQANADCYVPSLSGDGSRVAFQGYAYNLVADDTNSAADIFVKDMATGTIVRASTAGDGTQANGFSYFPSLSNDGSRVAFYSYATNLVAGDGNGVADVFVKTLATGALTLVSTSTTGVRGNGDSTYLSLSGQGNHVAFMSEATNLVTGDGNGVADIFVKDLTSGTLTRASTSAAGVEADAACYKPILSADGGKVAFFSTASNLVAGDGNGTWDVFVKDMASGAVTRASTASDGSQANGYSYDGWLSGDGRKVAFVSHATNLVAGDSNGVADIFVKDLITGALVRVSTAADGTQANGDSANPVLSADGTKVIFHSNASNLVAGDGNGASDIFVKDLITGSITRIAEDPSGDGLSLSADGSHAGFHSNVPTLVSGDSNDRWDVFVADISGATQPPPGGNRAPAAQPDKTLTVAEDSGATPLAITRPTDADGDPLTITVAAVPTAGRGAVYLADGTTEVVVGRILTAAQLEGLLFRPAADANGAAGGFRYTVSDGKGGIVSRTVSLAITAVNDAPAGVADSYQTAAGKPLVVAAAAGVLANDRDVDGDALTAVLAQGPAHGTLSLAADGSFVYTPAAGFSGADSFTYTARDGVAASQPVTVALTVRPAGAVTITRASTATDGTQANADCYVPSLSGDGSRVAFQGYAYNLVADDTNSAADIFVKDMATGTIVRASTAGDGTQANGFSYFPSLSNDGSRVAFYSYATNLVAGDGNGVADVFVKTLATGALTLVSTSTTGVRGNGDSTYLSLSGQGNHVAFMSEATNLVTGDGNGVADIFVKDLTSGTLTRASTSAAGVEADAACYKPILSADGGKVAFFSTASNLVAGDGNGTWDVFVKDMASGAVTRASTASDGSQANGYSYDGWLSGDGRKVAFVSHATNLVAGDSNGVADIFVKDLITGALVRVSTAADGTQANGDSANPVLSADGTKVAFHSHASNLVAGDTNGVSDIFVKDLLSGTVTRIAEDPSSDGLFFSADGLHVGFHSNVPTLVNGDSNDRWDVFVAGLTGA